MVRNRLAGRFLAAAVLAGATWPASAGAEGVTIIYPPKLDTARVSVPERESVPFARPQETTVNVILIDRTFFDRRSRKREIRRAFGQRYLGFYKTYSGPRYPSDM